MVHPNRRTPLTGLLIERIQRGGPIRFDEFMRDCLYHPEHGYYTSRVPKSGRRDFFTSPEVGPVFARMLAFQLTEMWERLGRPDPFVLTEFGTGDGRLAFDVLSRLRSHHEECLATTRYLLVEAAEALRGQAAERLSGFATHVATFPEWPAGPSTGCVFSNELIDAFPVRRFVQGEDALREILVGIRRTSKGIELAEITGDPAPPEILDYMDRHGAPLEEGQVAEVNLEALRWLEAAAGSLQRGYVLTIDYGHRARELYGPGHMRGTLLAYRDHRTNEDWLGWPGLQDLTAHVNFTALEQHGEGIGVESLGLVTQTSFLLSLARASGYLAELEGDPGDRARLARVGQFKQLIHPEGMGETFKVLFQGKGTGQGSLSGLEPF